jgi:hypothetical protein
MNITDRLNAIENGWEPIIIKDKKNYWAKAIVFFNSKLRYTREEYFLYMNCRKSNRLCTLDTYKNNLERAGFLKVIDRGMYKRIKKIPFDLTINKCLEIIKLRETVSTKENNKKLE